MNFYIRPKGRSFFGKLLLNLIYGAWDIKIKVTEDDNSMRFTTKDLPKDAQDVKVKIDKNTITISVDKSRGCLTKNHTWITTFPFEIDKSKAEVRCFEEELFVEIAKPNVQTWLPKRSMLPNA